MSDDFLSRQPTGPGPALLPLEHKGFVSNIYRWRTIGFSLYVCACLALSYIAIACQQLLAAGEPIYAALWAIISASIIGLLAYIVGRSLYDRRHEIPGEVHFILVPLSTYHKLAGPIVRSPTDIGQGVSWLILFSSFLSFAIGLVALPGSHLGAALTFGGALLGYEAIYVLRATRKRS